LPPPFSPGLHAQLFVAGAACEGLSALACSNLLSADGDTAGSVPLLAGAGGGGALVALIGAFLLYRWCKQKNKEPINIAVAQVRVKVHDAHDNEQEPLSPRRKSDEVESRPRGHSKLDALARSATLAAEKRRKWMKGERDIELARDAARRQEQMASVSCASAAPLSQKALMPSSQKKLLNEAPSLPSDPPASVGPLAPQTAAADAVSLGNAVQAALQAAGHASGAHPAPEEDEEAQAAPPPMLTRAGSMFVEKIGWMSSRAAKKLGKTGYKGKAAEVMARAAEKSAAGGDRRRSADRRGSGPESTKMMTSNL